MKFAKTTLSAIMLCLLLAACQAPQQSPDSTTAPDPVTIVADGTSQYQLVCDMSAGKAAKDLYMQFSAELSERTDFSFDLMDDACTNAKEVLIGNVDRPESIALQQKLEAAGGDRFGICVTEDTVVITGTNVYQTYLGLEHLMSSYLTTDESGSVSLIMPSGLEYISEAGQGLDKDDIQSLVDAKRGLVFSPVKAILRVPGDDDFSGTQGCGTDGTYVYVGKLDNSPNNPEHGKIYKYRLDTLELVAVSKSLPTNHTNDITYDPESGLLVVVGAMGSGKWMNGKLLCFVDPNTLELVKTVTAPVYLRGLQYVPELGQYIGAGTNYTFYRMDKNFKILSSFQCQVKSYTVQGLYADDTYIYDPRFYKTTSSTHYLLLYKLDGQLIGRVPMVDLLQNEPESIFVANGKYYLCCGMTHKVYEMELLPSVYWN